MKYNEIYTPKQKILDPTEKSVFQLIDTLPMVDKEPLLFVAICLWATLLCSKRNFYICTQSIWDFFLKSVR